MPLRDLLVIPLVLSVILMGGLAIYSWRLRRAPGALPFIIAVGIGALWATISTLDLQSSSLVAKVLLSRARTFVLAPLCVVTLVLVIEYTSHGVSISRKRLLQLCVVPFMTWCVVLTEEHHHLMRWGFHVDTQGVIPVLDYATGPWWVVHHAYGDILFLVACGLILWASRDASPLFVRQNLMILGAIVVPAVSDFLNSLGLAPIPGYNFTPSLLAATSLLLWWALLRDKALDILPIARSTIMDNMTDLLMIVDTRQRLVDANPAARDLLRLPRDAVGRDLEHVLAHWPELVAFWRDGRGVREMQVASGIYDAKLLPIRQKGGLVVGHLFLLTDVQARQQLQETFQRAKSAAEAAAEAKNLFLANVSHELRTPAGGVIGMLELLKDGNLGQEEREQAAIALRRAEDLLSLINDLLDFTRLEAGRIELESRVFPLEAMLQDVDDLFAPEFRAKGVAHSWQVEPDVPPVLRGDPRRLKQILVNLVGNALKFTATGSVTGTVACPERDESRVRLRFEVRDTGLGVPEARRRELFEPFTQADPSHTRRFGGTGLGLAICKRLCERMGGAIDFESEEGRGSRFWFTVLLDALPASQSPAPPEATTRVPPRHAGKACVLVAEDDATHRRILVTGLERAGFQVHAVADGRRALETLGTHPFDVVVLDCHMPDVSGYEVARALRAPSWEGPNQETPVIALTAGALAGDRERCLEAGMNDYLAKPARLQTLVSVLEKWLSKVDAAPPTPGEPPRTARPGACEASGGPTSDDPLDTVLADLAADLEVARDEAADLLRDFVATLPQTVERLCTQVQAGDAAAAALALHRFRGALDSLRLRGFSRSVRALEALGPDADAPQVRRHLEGLRARADELARAVSSHR